MFAADSLIDGKYQVEGICSDSGGMGALVHVRPIDGDSEVPIVLKYCRDTRDQFVRRFRREVRLLLELSGNSRVVDIVDSNLEHDPPYFVMKYYSDGDLSALVEPLRDDYEMQEDIFGQMIECVRVLHAAGKFHRDIKPQNFLRDGDHVVVSDLGLSTELDSSTAFTRSSEFWGTQGYLPPEFHLQGGFKNADASGDIFMLGKSIYVLLTGRDPLYLVPDGIPGPVFVVIERCCSIDKSARYGTLAALRQSLAAAYDMLLGRTEGPGIPGQLLRRIKDRIENNGQFRTEEVSEFIEKLAQLPPDTRHGVCFELDENVFQILKEAPFQRHLETFLDTYGDMVEEANYGWSYAESIADYMRILFDGPDVSPTHKTIALQLAIIAAVRQNRFAAMDTCIAMISSVTDDDLAMHVREMLLQYGHTFVSGIEASQCENATVGRAIQGMQEQVGGSETV